MVKDDETYFTFKKNVPYYNVGVRRSLTDTDGIILTNEFPTVRVEEKNIRDFKQANKDGLSRGLIVQVDEESLDWDLSNSISDEQVDELLKNYAKLKSTLKVITSQAIVEKILRAAEEQEKNVATRNVIKARLEEVTPEEQSIFRKEDMGSTFNG